MPRKPLPLKTPKDQGHEDYKNYLFISQQLTDGPWALTEGEKEGLERAIVDWWHKNKRPGGTAARGKVGILSMHPWVQVFP